MTQSLAEKLAALTNPTPALSNVNEDEEEDEVTGAKVTEADHFEDDSVTEERSHLRTVNASALDQDERYKGKKIKRKDYQKDRDLEEHSSAELGHLFDFGDDDEEEEGVEEEGGSDEDQEGSDDEEEGSEEDNESEEEVDESEQEDFGADISSFCKGNSQEVEGGDKFSETGQNMFKVAEGDSLLAKSQAVVAQLKAWDKLLEQRILLQKMLTKVNCFPTDPDSFIDSGDTDHVKLHSKANRAISSLLMKTGQLKNCLERKGVEDSKAMKRKLDDMSQWLEEDFSSGEQRRRERISMWSDRTQRHGNMSNMNTPALEQIEQITSNMPRLVKRTKIARMECNILGEQTIIDNTEGQTENANIFDDSDFYHHLLRELIEKKTSSSTESGEVGKHWLQIQKLRSKLKKKVDTRASKGRKVRYDIHTKLVNFMASVRLPDQMADNARQELFASIFGARKF